MKGAALAPPSTIFYSLSRPAVLRFQRDFDHVVEGRLTFSSSGLLNGYGYVVGHGADGQRFRAKLNRNAVDARRFHLYAQYAVFSITSNISPSGE